MENALIEKQTTNKIFEDNKNKMKVISSPLSKNDDSYLSYLKTKKILKEYSPAKGIYMPTDVLYYKSLSCSYKEDFDLYYEHIVNSYNAEFIYKFANYHADELSFSQMRDIYHVLVETENKKYIGLFAKNVVPKIKNDEEVERYC